MRWWSMVPISVHIIGDCSIDIDGHVLQPSSSHLFALLLILATSGERRTTRADLQRLLVGEPSKRGSGAHRMRQLLYRTKGLGLILDETPLGLRLSEVAVTSPIETLRRHTAETRASLTSAELQLFPGYAPPLTSHFAHWLEDLRDATAQSLVRLLRLDIDHLRASHSWYAVSRVCSHIRDLDPLNEEVAAFGAEALGMLGERDEALDVINAFARHSGTRDELPDGLRRLRARLAHSTPIPRTASLRGRADCLVHLSAEWSAAAIGGARVATLLGSPGIGKTRILREFEGAIALVGGRVLQHKCDASSPQYPLSLFAQMLPELRTMRGSLGIDPHHSTVLARLLPTTAPSVALSYGLDLEALRAELTLALVDLLEAVSAEHPLLITVDDAHLLDDSSCELLRTLAGTANSAAILVVACWRPRDRASLLFTPSSRASSHHLKPLSTQDSSDLLMELAPRGFLTPERLQWCITESGGNPFYLHSLSRLAPESCALPFDITSLAAASYFGLGAPARLALESCLYLGTLATLNRLCEVTAQDDLSLASALRELECMDLVSMQGTLVRGPHSLLSDAIRTLIPTTVSALLHRRIATTLTTECESESYSIPLALAAARSWLASGDNDAAVALLRRCASDVAAIGEPSTAAAILSQLAYGGIPAESRCRLLDDIIAYADAGGERAVVARAIKERLHLATLLTEQPPTLRQLRFRLIDASLFNGGDLRSSVQQLTSIFEECPPDDELRLKCIATLLVIADAKYDALLAHAFSDQMRELTSRVTANEADALRALLVYHTTFGDRIQAIQIAGKLMERFPHPDMNEQCRTARSFASYALYRLMFHSEAKMILEEDYRFMSSKGVRSEALYAASLLTEIAIAAGEFDRAREWFHEVDAQLNGAAAHNFSPNSGYYSSAALFAMMDGRHADAERLLAIPLAEDHRMRTPRYEAILCALRLRSALMNGTLANEEALVSRLWELYEQGRELGGQDTIVELLWCSEVLAGRTLEASALLRSYLNTYRREGPPIEWSLRATSSADDAWLPFSAASRCVTLAT